jgi:transcription elongation GreA/GreB family factor
LRVCVLYVLSSRRVDMSVAFVREESAAAAQEMSLPPRAISAHPNLVTQSGLRALERALADSRQALRTAQAIEDANERRRALELAARDTIISRNASRARFRSLSRLTRSWSRSAPRSRSCATTVAARRSGSLAKTRRIPAADRSPMCPPLAHRLIGKPVGEAVEMDGREIEVVAVE